MELDCVLSINPEVLLSNVNKDFNLYCYVAEEIDFNQFMLFKDGIPIGEKYKSFKEVSVVVASLVMEHCLDESFKSVVFNFLNNKASFKTSDFSGKDKTPNDFIEYLKETEEIYLKIKAIREPLTEIEVHKMKTKLDRFKDEFLDNYFGIETEYIKGYKVAINDIIDYLKKS